MNPWQATVVECLVVVCASLLCWQGVVPSEAVVALFTMIVGGRAIAKFSGGPPPGSGGTFSAVATTGLGAIALLLATVFLGDRVRGWVS